MSLKSTVLLWTTTVLFGGVWPTVWAQQGGASAPRRNTRSQIDPFDTSIHDRLLRDRAARRDSVLPEPRVAGPPTIQMEELPDPAASSPAGTEAPLGAAPPAISPPPIISTPAIDGVVPPVTASPDAIPLVDGVGLQESNGCAACGRFNCLGGWFCRARRRWFSHQPCTQPECPQCCGPIRWVEADYLATVVQGMNTPPLVSTGPAAAVQTTALETLSSTAAASVLYGGERIGEDVRSGIRLGFGEWFTPEFGVGAAYTHYGSLSKTFYRESSGDPVLARPFFNVEPGQVGVDSELIAAPGIYAGNIHVQFDSRLEGAEILARWRVNGGQLIAGYRYLRFAEALTITDIRQALAGAPDPLTTGTLLSEMDRFATRNDFNGLTLGAGSQWTNGRWMSDVTLLVGFGSARHRAVIDGETTVYVPLPGGGVDVTTTSAGLLAQQIDNIGQYEDRRFAMVPELGLQLGYAINSSVRATVGYRLLYWSRVVRPGDLIDEELNLSQLSGPINGLRRPAFAWNYTDLWAQSLTFGLDATF